MTNALIVVGRVPEWTTGDRLRKARTHANVSADEMADIIGRGVRTIYNYENGHTDAPLGVVRLYALRCQVPLEWLTNGIDPREGDELRVTLRYPQIQPLIAVWRNVPWAGRWQHAA